MLLLLVASHMATVRLDNNGGYYYDFISTPPDRLICKICQLPSRDPYLSVCCGHVFCKSCLDNIKKATAVTNACPICRDEEFVTFPNKQANREVKDLHIYCTNREKGCRWEGKLNDINDHLGNSDGCQFEEVKCFNECGKMMQRQYLSNHIETECLRRKVNCQYCQDTGEYEFIEGQHKEECSKLPLPCPNKCGVASVICENMEAHRKECPLEMIQCEYHSVGCEIRMTRKDQDKHKQEKMEEHLSKTIRVLTHELNSTKLELTVTKQELTDIKGSLVETNYKLANAESTLTDTNNQLATALQRISTLEVLLYLATDKEITRPTSSVVVMESSVGWSDKLVAMVMMSKSNDQELPVTLEMSEYGKKKKTNVEWYSNPFYTHNKGYKMCLNIDAAGHGKGKSTHLSMFLYLMKGPHDDELTWPLMGKFEIKLLNQINDSEHHFWIVNYDEKISSDKSANRIIDSNRAKDGQGRHKFITNDNLNKITPTCQYLKNDSLFIQVTKLNKA